MEQLKKTINGNDYQMIKFGALKSLKLSTKIAKAIEVPSVEGKSEESMIQKVALGIISNEDFSNLVEDLTSSITHNGLSIDFDNHFSKHPKDLLPCVGWSLKENIVPFFDPAALATLFETALGDIQ